MHVRSTQAPPISGQPYGAANISLFPETMLACYVLHIMRTVRILSASGALSKEPEHCREVI